MKFRLSLFAIVIFELLLFFQNCSVPLNFFSSTMSETHAHQSAGNGQGYDGKLRILHHRIDGFTCEGQPAPESILIRLNGEWYLTRNTQEKCNSTFRVLVQGVVYDDIAKQAFYEGKLYLPPLPYFVDAKEDPNLPDVDLLDGVCADKNGICSLRAAVDQSVPTALTSSVAIEVPTGNFILTSALKLSIVFSDSFGIKIHGMNPTESVIDGGLTSQHLSIRSYSTSPVELENLTFQNGFDPSTLRAASIFADPSEFVEGDSPSSLNSILNISNCIFKNNRNAPVIYGGLGSGTIHIRNTEFTDNNDGVRLNSGNAILIEGSSFLRNSRGVSVSSNSGSAVIRDSSFSENYEGINFYNCKNCLIENVTATGQLHNGFYFTLSNLASDTSYDLVVKSSTLNDNAKNCTASDQSPQPCGNISFSSGLPSRSLSLNDSQLQMPTPSINPNCNWVPTAYHNIIVTNSVISDNSCSP